MEVGLFSYYAPAEYINELIASDQSYRIIYKPLI